MTFPISEQVNDQVKAKKLIEHLKMSLDGLGEINRAFVVAFKMPTEKQIAKYEKLAEQLTAEQIEILRFSTRPKSNKQIQEWTGFEKT